MSSLYEEEGEGQYVWLCMLYKRKKERDSWGGCVCYVKGRERGTELGFV